MPYALYSKATGIISGVFFQMPTHVGQISALRDQGMEFVEVGAGISAGNSYIDLNTGQPAPTGPAMTHIWKVTYDPDSGLVTGSVHGNVDNTMIPTSSVGVIISATNLNYMVEGARKRLTVDGNGMPTKNPDGSFVCADADYVPQPPNAIDLLLLSQINAGNLDPDHIPDDTLTMMNANLATVGAPEIVKSSELAKAAPAAP